MPVLKGLDVTADIAWRVVLIRLVFSSRDCPSASFCFCRIFYSVNLTSAQKVTFSGRLAADMVRYLSSGVGGNLGTIARKEMCSLLTEDLRCREIECSFFVNAQYLGGVQNNPKSKIRTENPISEPKYWIFSVRVPESIVFWVISSSTVRTL